MPNSQSTGTSGITARLERQDLAITLPYCARRDHHGGPHEGGRE